MGSQLKLKNANGVTATIANEDTNTSDITLNTGELASKSTPVADRIALLARTGIVDGEAVWQTDIGLMYIWTNTQGVDNGGTIINVGTGSWVASYSGAVNVKWFGAVVDTDTTTILNSLLASFNDVVLDENYLLSDTLTLNSYNHLHSNNRAVLTTTKDADYLEIAGNYIRLEGIIFKNTTGLGTFKSILNGLYHNFVAEKCEFDGCQLGVVQSGANGEYDGGIGYSSIIRNCVVKNISAHNGIEVVNANNVKIEHNEVYDCDGEGIKVGGSASSYIVVNFNYCHNNGRDGIDLFNGGRKGECIGNRVVNNTLQGIEIKYPTDAFIEDGINSEKFILSNNIITGNSIAINAYANNIIINSNYCEGEIISGGWNTIVSNNIVISGNRGISAKGLSNGRISNNSIKMIGGSSSNYPLYTGKGNSTGENPQDIENKDITIENNTIDAGGYSYGITVAHMVDGNICNIKDNIILNVTSTGTFGGKDYVRGYNNNNFQDDVVIAATNNLLFNSSSTSYKNVCNSVIKNARVDVIHRWKGLVEYNSASGTTYGGLTIYIDNVETTLVANLWTGTINENVEFDIKIIVVDETTLSIAHWNSFTGVYDHTEATDLTGLMSNDLKFNIKGQTGTSDAAYRKYHHFSTISSKNRYY